MCVFLHIINGFVKYILALKDNNGMKMDGLYPAVYMAPDFFQWQVFMSPMVHTPPATYAKTLAQLTP